MKQIIAILSFFLLGNFTSEAQVSFTSSVDSGCVPLSVSFTNTSNIGSTFVWYYGNGVMPDTTLNGATVYTFPYEYVVNMIAYDSNMQIVGVGADTISAVGNPAQVFHNSKACPGEAINFYFSNGNNPAMFSWKFSDGFQTTTGNSVSHAFQDTGLHSVTIYFNTLCGPDSLTSFISIGTSSFIEVNYIEYPEDPVCPNDMLSFNVGTSFSNTINWNFGDGSSIMNGNSYASHSFATPGTYIVTATISNLCGNDTVIEMPVVVELNAPAIIESFYMDAEVACPGQKVFFSGGNYSESFWQFGDGTEVDGPSSVSHSYSQPGTYYVTLTVTNGCGNSAATTDYISIEDSIPVQNLYVYSSMNDGCPGEIFKFTASSGLQTYSWNFGDGVSMTTLNREATHAYATPGVYTLTLTGTNFCGLDSSITTMVSVSSNSQPDVPGISFSKDQACPGDIVSVQVYDLPSTSSVTYNFGNGPQSSSSYSFNSTGVFPIEIIITNACGNTAVVTRDFTVSDSLFPMAPDIFSIQNSYCPGDLVSVIVPDQGDSVVFNFGDGTGIHQFQSTIIDGDSYIIGQHPYGSTGTYPVTVTSFNACGLSSTSSVNVTIGGNIVPEPEFSIMTSDLIQDSLISFIAFGADSMIMNFGDGSIPETVPALTEFTHVFSSPGEFDITLTGYNGCGLSGTFTQTIDVLGFVGLRESVSSIPAEVYPNPVSGVLNIKSRGLFKVEVYDITGLLKFTSRQMSDQTAIDLSNFAPGVYLVKVSGNSSTVRKIIKQ